METEVLADAEAVARRAAAIVAAEAHEAVGARGRFALAISGGHTPWLMLRALAGEDVPWDGLHLFQVDERVAPAGDPDHNWTHLRESLLDCAPCGRTRPTRCRSSRPTWRPRPRATPKPSAKLPANRRCWTSCIWASGRTDTPPPWCPATWSSMSRTPTWHSPGFTRGGGG